MAGNGGNSPSAASVCCGDECGDLCGHSYLFWKTQPVMQFVEVGDPTFHDGPILPRTPQSDVNQEPIHLPSQFEWASIDVDNDASFADLHRFLAVHFFNRSSIFAFPISPAYLRWFLRAPGHIKSLHVAVCVRENKKIVAFIAGVPSSIRIVSDTVRVAEAAFLCIHRKLRSQRLTPILIRELARRALLEDIWQGVYATPRLLPTPFCSSHLLERLLDPKKLIELGYIELTGKMTMARAVKMYKLPPAPETAGFRKMAGRDVAAVALLLPKYLKKFKVAPAGINEHFVVHSLLPRRGVVESYVVENPETRQVTDFCSFLVQTVGVEKNPKYSELKSGVLFYYAAAKTPVLKLVRDSLVMAKRDGFDLFRAQGIMESGSFLDRLTFRVRSGATQINYYLYNYRLGTEVKPGEFDFMSHWLRTTVSLSQ